MADINGSSIRENYLKHIEYLTAELERYQPKCNKLEKQNQDLASQYSALEKAQRDITKSLKRTMVVKEKKVDELTERLKSQRQASEQDIEVLKLQHRQQIQKLQERVDELNSVMMMHVAESEEHKEQLMKLLPHIESLEKQLASQKKENELLNHSLMMDIECLKKHNREPVTTVDDCVKIKTSDILHKERARDKEQSKEILFLLNYNIAVRKEIDALQRKLCNLKNESCGFYPPKIIQHPPQEQLKVEVNHKQMLAKAEDLRLALVSEESKTMDQLMAKIEMERNRSGQLQSIMGEADIILKDILVGSEDSEKMPNTEWEIERLLDILESTAHMETGSAFKDFTDRSS